MKASSDYTRERILRSAVALFADRGYGGASVRAIVARAKVNQAAINYHFGGKEGLYRAVLQTAFAALTRDASIDARTFGDLSREEALRRFVRRQLRPLLARDDLSRYFQLFNWETLRPSPVFKTFLSEDAAPFIGQAQSLVRRFMPDASDRVTLLAAIWLIGQCSVFVRYRAQLGDVIGTGRAQFDDVFVDEIADSIGRWAIGGLAGA